MSLCKIQRPIKELFENYKLASHKGFGDRTSKKCETIENYKMGKIKGKLKTIMMPFIRIVLIPYRLRLALSYYNKPLKNIFIWLIKSKEHTNFTYELEDINKEYLVSLISVITKVDIYRVKDYILEIEQDEQLREHIRRLTISSSKRYVADMTAKYSQRIGWYAMIRIKKPKIVIETGIDKGLGACINTAALMKNIKEGFNGYYYGTDINENAGYLFKEPYNKYGKILYGDSIESLKKLTEPIDMFIHSVFHSSEYEMNEYKTIKEKLTEDALIISHRAHIDKELYNFAILTNRNFIYFQEKPKLHWYPGAGMGIAFKK